MVSRAAFLSDSEASFARSFESESRNSRWSSLDIRISSVIRISVTCTSVPSGFFIVRVEGTIIRGLFGTPKVPRKLFPGSDGGAV